MIKMSGVTQIFGGLVVLMKILLVLIILYLLFSVINPALTLTAEIDKIFITIFADIPGSIFTFLNDISEWLRNSTREASSGVGTAVLFISWMGSLMLSFAIPLLYYAIALTLIVISVIDFYSFVFNQSEKR